MICKLGFHHVKRHFRRGRTGKRHVVEAHCRINPKSKRDILFASNLNYLFQHNKGEF